MTDEYKLTRAPPKLTAVEKFGIASVIATGLAGIADTIMNNPNLMKIAVAGAGVVLTNPIGGPILGLIAFCAVSYYAVLAVKAKFHGLYKILRTLDEFTILLEKIQRMLQITVFISGTYNFQINVDEITNQMKIILTRFEKTLTDVDIKQIQSDATDAKKLEKLNEDTTNAANKAGSISETMADAANSQADNNQGADNLDKTKQKGGGILDSIKSSYKKFSFPVDEWNRNLLDDITKLNIRLTTAMGEFTIVLNVIQMNMIADGINQDNKDKIQAIAVFVKKITTVKSSSEYKRMRIGILLNDILALKVDFDFCQKGDSGSLFGTRPSDDTICLEYTETDTAGNRITNFRPKLHHMIILLCETLKKGEGYDAPFIDVVKTNIIDPYIKLLEEAKFSNSTATISDTLKTLNLELSILTDADKTEIDNKLDELIAEVNAEISKTQIGGGGLLGFFSKKDTPAATTAPAPATATTPATVIAKALTPAQINIIKYLKKSPTNIISDESFKAYLNAVYRFSKEISKPTVQENKESQDNIDESVAPATNVDPTKAAETTTNVDPATTAGGRRHTRKKLRKPKMSKAKSYKYRVRL
jgi:hypothetical protein